MDDIVTTLHQISEAPIENADFDRWLGMSDPFAFLRANVGDDEFLVYANAHRAEKGENSPTLVRNVRKSLIPLEWNCSCKRRCASPLAGIGNSDSCGPSAQKRVVGSDGSS